MCGTEQSKELLEENFLIHTEREQQPRQRLPFTTVSLSKRQHRKSQSIIITPFFDNGYRFFNIKLKNSKENQIEKYFPKWAEFVISPIILNPNANQDFNTSKKKTKNNFLFLRKRRETRTLFLSFL